MSKTLRVGMVALLMTVVLSSCGPDPVLPQGPQTLKGTLKTAELARVRRGTHVLEQSGVRVYYVESTTVNLRPYENTEVTLTGVLEPNTDDKSLPVLVVSDLLSEKQQMRSWKVPTLSLTLSAPETWLGRTSSGGIAFLLGDETVLTVRKSALQTMPNGAPYLFGNFSGRRILENETGKQTVYVQVEGKIIVFLFTPPKDPVTAPYSTQHFDAVLKSVQFQGKQASSSVRSHAGSQASIPSSPCGGAAGFLCPQGSYCAIDDVENNIGHCKAF